MSPKPSRAREVTADVLEPRVFGSKDVGAGRNDGFYARVYAVVDLVPHGRVTTYGDVGTILGSPRVARQVGWALASLPPDSRVPWHRVINAHGMVSWRGELARAALQEALLRAEGIAIDERGRLDLPSLRWHYPDVIVPFTGPTHDDVGPRGRGRRTPRAP